jgi:hypothetical protein
MPRARTPVAVPTAAVLVLAAAACVRVSVTPLGAGTFPAVPPDSVRVFATQAPPSYTEVAVLRAAHPFAGGRTTLRALRARAGQLGANGLLLLNTRGAAPAPAAVSGVVVGGPQSGGLVLGQADGDVDDFGRAVAIRIPPTAPGAASPSSASRP